MSDLYVADILGARRPLRQRAAEAHDLALQAEQDRRAAEEQDIIVAVCAWLRDELQCHPPEIEDIEFVRGPKSSDGSVRQVHFTLDSVQFRAYFTREKVATISTDAGTRTEAIYDSALEVQASKSGATWVMVRDLKDVGSVIR